MTTSKHNHPHTAPRRWKPHLDWRMWVVALMLIAMLVYIFTMDEALNPAAPGSSQPMPADAP